MKEIDLPQGWILVTLEDVLSRSSEKVTPSKGQEKNGYYVGLEHIEKGTRRIVGAEIVDFSATKNAFDRGDILYGKLRPYLNKVAIAPYKGVCSTDIVVYKAPNFTTANFLVYFMSSRKFVNDMSANTSGINLPRVSTKYLSNYQVPLPPFPEQHRIVAKLEELFSELDNGTANLKKAQAQLKVYRQAVLKAAFEGKLTEQWRAASPEATPDAADKLLEQIQAERQRHSKKPKEYPPLTEAELTDLPALPEGWIWRRLGDFSQMINGDRGKNYPNKNEYVAIGVPFINTGHIKPNGSLDLSQMNFITKEKFHSLNSGKICRGDLIYCLRGATIGKTAILDMFDEGAIASSLVIVRPSNILLNRFAYYYLISPLGKKLVKRFDNGSAQPNLSAYSLTQYPIPFLPKPEQIQIVQEIESRLSVCDHLEQEIDKALRQSEALRQSILKKAFEGRLVPQDPGDEPAEELLKRIKKAISSKS